LHQQLRHRHPAEEQQHEQHAEIDEAHRPRQAVDPRHECEHEPGRGSRRRSQGKARRGADVKIADDHAIDAHRQQREHAAGHDGERQHEHPIVIGPIKSAKPDAERQPE
jgi:hypothetical protein